MTPGARSIFAVALCCAGWPLHALDLSLPASARETASRDSVLDQVAVPVAPFADGALPMRSVQGPVARRAFRIPSSGLTPLQILAPLREQLEAEGYDVLLDCNARACGGFDFRFAIDVLPAPNMYVNIRDYQFLSAEQPATGAIVTLLASAAAGAGYLQVIQIGEAANLTLDRTVAPIAPATPSAAPLPDGDLITRLTQTGRGVLRGLDFAVGATTLNGGTSPDLAAVAELLKARPTLRIAVVGHTDTVGGLDANINVSRARAQSVRAALIDTYGAPADRIEAAGMGYLSPAASNLTPEGREANRRVEIIFVSEDG